VIRFDDILDQVAGRFGDKDIAVLQKAYVFSAKAHKGQVRRSGEPYLSHPLEVTSLLAGMNMDRTTLVGGLLHDVLEDAEVTPAELKEAFGKDVAGLVDSVTKISLVQEASAETRRAETIRKIILAMTDDIRVIFIKLADRLHNLQTLAALPEDDQKRIAAETLEIYAPIANRLGMGRIKAELEDLAFRSVDPEASARITALIEPRRAQAEADLARFKTRLAAVLAANGVPAEIFQRIKRPYSIYQKMKAQNIDFSQVYDFLALRIITDSVKNCYGALGIIHQTWPPLVQRFRDFIAVPKPNLYQALHTTIITEDKRSIEIQIRTREMHALAENGIAAHWKYKEADPQSLVKDDRRLHWLREMVELFSEQKDPREFLKNLKINLIPEEVYVFTPKGRVVSLPTGASALDFAFRIHTEIGLHGVQARINGKPAPLKTRLKTGDIVEIQTSPEKVPTRSALNIAFTSGARHQLKRWLKQQERTRSVALGKKLWEKAVRKYGPRPEIPQGPALLEKLGRGWRAATVDEFFARVGIGKVVLSRKFLDKIAPVDPEAGKKNGSLPRPDAEISGKDYDEGLVRLAQCCRPIKGEPIIGYITAGKGITVHAARCPRVVREVLAPERLVEVSWSGVVQEDFSATLVIRSSDAPGLLADVASRIAALGGNIAKAEVETFPDGSATIRCGLRVRDIRHLEAITADIAGLKDIRTVERA
jgi:guanosine-3',5'-bis(diphosphate) 3'-pyrophosphohydrolase